MIEKTQTVHKKWFPIKLKQKNNNTKTKEEKRGSFYGNGRPKCLGLINGKF